MTKYVLNSGGIRSNPDLAKQYFAEVLKGLGEEPRLLICCFAQPREDWEPKFAQDKDSNSFPEGVRPVLELAFPDTFEEQVKNSDAMYIHGGDDHLIQYWLGKFTLPGLWEGKVVATNSASSDALSTAFWPYDWRKPMEGMGLLPIKFFPHYQSRCGDDDPRGPVDWEAARKELEAYGEPDLPVHALKEGEFVVIET